VISAATFAASSWRRASFGDGMRRSFVFVAVSVPLATI
jgi:hypothetical protein